MAQKLLNTAKRKIAPKNEAVELLRVCKAQRGVMPRRNATAVDGGYAMATLGKKLRAMVK